MFHHLTSDQRKNPDRRIPVYAQREVVIHLLDSEVGQFGESVAARRREMGMLVTANEKDIAEGRLHGREEEVYLLRRGAFPSRWSVTGGRLVAGSPQPRQHAFVQDGRATVRGCIQLFDGQASDSS